MRYDTYAANRFPMAEQRDQRLRFLGLTWIDGGLIVFFWILIALLAIAQLMFDPRSAGDGGLLQGEAVQTFFKYTVWAVFTPFIFWMSAHFTLDRRGWLRLAPLYIVLGVAIAAVVDLIDHKLWNVLVPDGPPRPMSLTFVLSGFHFLSEFAIFVFVLIAGFARHFFFHSQKNQKEAAQLQAHLAEARLRTLRMQINPHFLFNTLHVISDNFEEDPRIARRMIARLSDILRYTFEKTEAREVTLGQELEFLDGYLDIQRFRFEDKLSVTMEIAPEVREALIPNLILQPLVENAIKHGISQCEGPGQLTLRAWREAETLHLMVIDNGPGLAPASGDGALRTSSGVGLRNTRERLQGLYGSAHTFVVESPLAGGFTAYITLPFHTQADFRVMAIDEA